MLSSARKTDEKRLKPLLLVFILFLLLVACWIFGKEHENRTGKGNEEEYAALEVLPESFPRLALSDMDQDTSGNEAAEIDLTKTVNGECIIRTGGTYRLTGSLKGNIRIAAEDQNVHLILSRVTVSSPEGPALFVESAGKVILTLSEGVSTISDSSNYRGEQEAESCIYSTCDLTINGNGELIVNGYYKDAIRSKDVLRVVGGMLTIKSKRTGLHGTDGILVTDGKIVISSEKNGFKTTRSGTDGRGNLVIAGGELSVIAGEYAFVCGRGDVYIYGCTVRQKSVIADFDAGGRVWVQSGSVR